MLCRPLPAGPLPCGGLDPGGSSPSISPPSPTGLHSAQLAFPPAPALGFLGLGSSAPERCPPQVFHLPLAGLLVPLPSLCFSPSRGSLSTFLAPGQAKGESGEGSGGSRTIGLALRNPSARVESGHREAFHGCAPGDELPADLVPVKDPLPGLQTAIYLLAVPHMAEWGWGGGEAALWPLLIRTLITSQASPLMT